MPQEVPKGQRRVPVSVPGYKPFQIPEADTVPFMEALRLIEAEGGDPQWYSELAYRAFTRQENLGHSPQVDARFRPIMEETYSTFEGPRQTVNAPQEKPRRRPIGMTGEEQTEARRARIRATAPKPQPTAPTSKPDNGNLLSRSLDGLVNLYTQEGRGEGERAPSIIGKFWDLASGPGTTRPKPSGGEPWGPETRDQFREAESGMRFHPPELADVQDDSALDVVGRAAGDYLRESELKERADRMSGVGVYNDPLTDPRLVESQRARRALGIPELNPGQILERADNQIIADAVRLPPDADPGPDTRKSRYERYLGETHPGPVSEVRTAVRQDLIPQTAEQSAWDQTTGEYVGEWAVDRARNVAATSARAVSGAARLGALGARVVGAYEVQAEMANFADFASAAAEEYTPKDIPTLQQLATGKYPGSTALGILEWVSHRGTEGVTSMIPVLASGKVASMLGAGQKVMSGVMFSTAYVQNYGELYQGLVEAGVPDNDALNLAAVYTIPVAGLDMVGARGVAGDALNPVAKRALVRDVAKAISESRWKTAGRGAVRGFLTEAPTEGAQDAVGIISEIVHGTGEPPTAEDIPEYAWRILESFAAGGLVGGTVGGAMSAANRPGKADLDRALYQSRSVGVSPDPEAAARGELFERRRGYPQPFSPGSARVDPKSGLDPRTTIKYGRRAGDVDGVESVNTGISGGKAIPASKFLLDNPDKLEQLNADRAEAGEPPITLERLEEIEQNRAERGLPYDEIERRRGRTAPPPTGEGIHPAVEVDEEPEPVVDAQGVYEIPAGRDATKYQPPRPGQELRSDLIPEYIAATEDVQRRDDVFQFRTTGPRSQGKLITDEEEWSPALAAATTMWAWKDTEGELGTKDAIYIVDGHNRLDKAQRSGVGHVNLKFLNDQGKHTVQEARVAAALINIAGEKVASPELLFDAVTVMREAGLTREELDKAAGGRRSEVFDHASAIASLPQGIYDNYRDQQKRSFEHDALYVALGSHGLSDSDALAVWKAITEGKKPNHRGYIPTPGGKKNVASIIDGIVGFARAGMEAEATGQEDMFGGEGGVTVSDQLVWVGQLVSDVGARIRGRLNLGKTFGKKGGTAEAEGLIEGYKPERAEELTEEATAALAKWEMIQRDEAMRDYLFAQATKLKKAKSKDKRTVKEETWNEISKALFAADTGVETEGVGDVLDDAGGSEVSETAADYAPEAATGTEAVVEEETLTDWEWTRKYGRARKGSQVVFGPFELRWSENNERYNVIDKRTGENADGSAKNGYKKLSAARNTAEELMEKDSRARIAGQAQAEPTPATLPTPQPVIEDPGDGPQPETQPGPGPVMEAEVEIEPPPTLEGEIEVEAEPVEQEEGAYEYAEFEPIWESGDAPGSPPETVSHQRESVRRALDEVRQRSLDAGEGLKFFAKGRLRRQEEHNMPLLFRNIAMLHYTLLAKPEGSSTFIGEAGRRTDAIRQLLMDMYPHNADIIDDIWKESSLFPLEMLMATHLEFLQREGFTLDRTLELYDRISTRWGLITDPARALRYPSGMGGTGDVIIEGLRRTFIGASRRNIISQSEDLKSLQRHENTGRSRKPGQLTGKKLDTFMGIVAKVYKEVEADIKFMTYSEVQMLMDVIDRVNENGDLNPVWDRVMGRNQAGKHKYNAWERDPGGYGWNDPTRDSDSQYAQFYFRLLERQTDLQWVYRWFMNPEFGQPQTKLVTPEQKRTAARHAQREGGPYPPDGVRPWNFMSPEQRDLWNNDPELFQADFIEEAERQGVIPSQVDPAQLIQQRNQKVQAELEQYVEDMYDEWWDSRQAKEESPLSLPQLERLLYAMKLLSTQTGMTLRNTNDVHILGIQVETLRDQQRTTPDRAMDVDRHRLNEASVESFVSWAREAVGRELDEEMEGVSEEREAYVSRRLLTDTGIYDNDPDAQARASGTRIHSIQEAFDAIEAAIEVTLRTGKQLFQPGTLGVFKVKVRAIRLRYEQDEEAGFHEFGHAFQYLIFGEHAYTPSGRLSNQVLSPWAVELIALGKGVSKADNVEGMAEFVRRYFNNPKSAATEAPTFYVFFEKALQANHPVVFERVQEVREMLDLYRNGGPRARMQANFQYQGRDNPLLTKWEANYRALVDAFYPVSKWARETQGTPSYRSAAFGLLRRGRKDPIDVWNDVEILGRTLNGTNAMAEHWIRRGQIRHVHRMDLATGEPVVGPGGIPIIDTIVVGPSMEAILANVRNDLAHFEHYITARRVIERFHAPMMKATKLAAQYNAQFGAERYLPMEDPGDPGKVGVWDDQTNRFVKTFKRMELAFRYEDAKQIVDEVKLDPTKLGTYEAVFDEIQTYRKNLLQYLVDSGALTAAARDRVLQGSTSYVPFRTAPIVKPGAKGVVGVLTGAKGAETPHIGAYRAGHVPPGVYRQSGHGGPIIPPLESIYRDTYEMLAVAHRARLAGALHELSEQHGQGKYLEGVMVKVDMTKLTLKDVLKQIKEIVAEDVYDELVKGITDVQLAHSVLWAFSRGDYFGKRGMVSFVDRKGKRHWYEVKDRDLYESLMALESPSNGFMRLLFPAAPARWLRVGSTVTPSFSAIRNPSRDIVMGGVQSRHGLPGIVSHHHLRALRSLWRGERNKPDEMYDRFIRGLGSFGALVDFDRASIQREIDKQSTVIFGKGSVRFKARPVKIGKREFKVPFGYVLKDGGDALKLLSAMTENMTRMAEFNLAYKTYTEQGYGTAEAERIAGYDARDVTVDFRRHGAGTFAFRQGVAFWNANIQGWDKTIRTFKEDPGGAFMRSVMYITIPSVVLWALQHNDDDYRELPQWLRDYFWLIPVGNVDILPDWLRDDRDPNMFVQAASPVTGRGSKIWLKIAKPFGLGTIFGTLPERMLDMAYHEDEEGLADAFKDMIIREAVGFLPIPTWLAPLAENLDFINYSLFFNRPVVGREYENVDGRYAYEPTSSGLSRWAGDQLNVSPLKIDNVLYSYFGTAMRDALRVTDAAIDMMGGREVQTAGTLGYQRIPMVRDIVQGNTQWTSYSVSRLYERGQDSKGRAATNSLLNSRAMGGNPQAIEEWFQYLTNTVQTSANEDEAVSIALAFVRWSDKERQKILSVEGMPDVEKNKLIFMLADLRTVVSKTALGWAGD